jgi:hypothetical protein
MRLRAAAGSFFLSLNLLSSSPLAAAPAAAPKPSRKPLKGCKWEKLTDAAAGLEAWAQRCDFGFRKIDFLFERNALLIRYSDGGKPEPVVEVFDLRDGETPEAGVRRLWTERTPRFFHGRCVVAPYGKPPAGAAWLTVEPDAAYGAELKKKQDPNEVPPPPCGEWGYAPDGVQYWEAQPGSGARKVLFVRAGQDTPLFDERTLRLLPPR